MPSTTDSFREHIRKSLNDQPLQAALDANAERRIKVRREAFASLPDAEARRQKAHNVRAKVISNLAEAADSFATKASQNGMIVHRAASAKEAVSIVLEIARMHNANLISKSKTMLGEEIELNPALEEAGLKVIETDLGEYIVQIRGEPPAHIITPAVHLSRQEVGQTFHEKLGIPYTDDIPTLTAAARSVLRDTFLKTDIGISGVNFGVAETGTLCVLTNEGNGRMVTTVPPVHIALMGIERIVPSLDDLALMISLLPRSATGQKITVYTSLINGPRRPEDPDGPQERHLILVDNGRIAASKSPIAEILYCIRCGACLNACPVFRELGGHAYKGVNGRHTPYPGPMGSVISPLLFGFENYGNLPRASSLCGACKDACPVDIDIPRLLLRLRAGEIESPKRKVPTHVPWYLRWGISAFTFIASRPKLFSLSQKAAGVGGWIAAFSSKWIRLPAFTGWGYSKDFPRPDSRPFSARWKDLEGSMEPEEVVFQISTPIRIQDEIEDILPPDLNDNDRTSRFIKELEALGGKAVRCSANDLPGQILSLVKEWESNSIVAWDEKHLPDGLIQSLKSSSITVNTSSNPAIKVGLTGAVCAAAETGSILLPGGPGRSLTASLLPELHIAVLKEKDIKNTLTEILHAREIYEASALSVVTGPSRTADIEMALTIGVHGPKEIFVFIIPG